MIYKFIILGIVITAVIYTLLRFLRYALKRVRIDMPKVGLKSSFWIGVTILLTTLLVVHHSY